MNKDLEGNVLKEIKGSKKAGLHKTSWDLRKKEDSQEDGRRRRGRGAMVECGKYKATFTVEEKEICTRELKVIQDPIRN